MSKILHIDASSRSDRSVSRALAKDFVAALPVSQLTYRDIGHNPPPFVTESWVAGAFNPPEARDAAAAEAIAVSDAYVDELLAADKIVISTPMYNLSIPAVLKAWIDQIVRVGRTFAFTEKGLSGLLAGKKVVIIATSGSPLAGTPYDFLEPYLRGIFGFVGVTDVTFVRVEGFSGPEEGKVKAKADAQAKLAGLATTW